MCDKSCNAAGESPKQMVDYETYEVEQYSPVNNTVACKPVSIGVQQKKAENGLITLSNRNTLLETEAVFVDEDRCTVHVKAGDKVYFDARNVTADWAKSQYEVNGQVVIFVPWTAVALVKRKVKRLREIKKA